MKENSLRGWIALGHWSLISNHYLEYRIAMRFSLGLDKIDDIAFRLIPPSTRTTGEHYLNDSEATCCFSAPVFAWHSRGLINVRDARIEHSSRRTGGSYPPAKYRLWISEIVIKNVSSRQSSDSLSTRRLMTRKLSLVPLLEGKGILREIPLRWKSSNAES